MTWRNECQTTHKTLRAMQRAKASRKAHGRHLVSDKEHVLAKYACQFKLMYILMSRSSTSGENTGCAF